MLGLSIEEAIVFWNKSFKMTDEQFNKEHRYIIRHSFGLEGKRANYPAKRCAAQCQSKIRLTGSELRATTDMWAIGARVSLPAIFAREPVERASSAVLWSADDDRCQRSYGVGEGRALPCGMYAGL